MKSDLPLKSLNNNKDTAAGPLPSPMGSIGEFMAKGCQIWLTLPDTKPLFRLTQPRTGMPQPSYITLVSIVWKQMWILNLHPARKVLKFLTHSGDEAAPP